MSRRSLKTVLSSIKKDVVKRDYVRRQLSGKQKHIYTLDAESLTQEIIFDLRNRHNIQVFGTDMAAIREAALWYVESLAKAFDSNKFLKRREKSGLKGGKLKKSVKPKKVGPGKYVITIEEDDGKNIFRRITDIKRTYNRLLERKVAKALKMNKKTFDSTGGDRSKGLIDLGHELGSSIAETAGTLVLGNNLESIRSLGEEYESVNIFLKKIGRSLNPVFEIRVTDEATAANVLTHGKGERGALTAIANAIEEVLKDRTIDWPKAKGSPNIPEALRAALIYTARGKKYKDKISSSMVKETLKSKTSLSSSSLKLPAMEVEKQASPEQENWTSLIPLINSRLRERVIANMRFPALVNRTGTFAASAVVTGVQTTPKGYPSFAMSYDKNPYGVFDRRIGALPWATPSRDPYTIIERSLREVLNSIGVGKFYARRT